MGNIPISSPQHRSAMVKDKMDLLVMVGVLALYFALQLWILPKMGINT